MRKEEEAEMLARECNISAAQRQKLYPSPTFVLSLEIKHWLYTGSPRVLCRVDLQRSVLIKTQKAFLSTRQINIFL